MLGDFVSGWQLAAHGLETPTPPGAASQQFLLHGLMDGPHNRLEAETKSKRTIDVEIPGIYRRISTTYEVRGMVQNVTSYENATVGSGTVVNDVQNVYNSFSQLINQYQSHSGAVNTALTPSVQYGYADGNANTIRPTSITYPNGRVINRDYGTTGAMNDQLSRIASVIDSDVGTTHLADYTYVGLNRIAQVNSVQPGTALTYIKQGSEGTGDGGDQYTGWDRFTRVIDQRWILTSTTAALERIQYSFDRVGNRLYRANMVASGGQDEYYTYDKLYQLLELQRGTLNSTRTGISGTPVREEDFSFDPTGNWNTYVTKVMGATVLNQGRTHNKVNEITAIDGSSTYIEENAVGNIIVAPRTTNWLAASDQVYDAWNRLVSVHSLGGGSSSNSGGGGTTTEYAYDGMNRRVNKTTGTTMRHYYYTRSWQIAEERISSATSADRQFVWGLRYLDDLVLRDRGSERFYAFNDYFNCTAIANTSGVVQERYGYNAFGQPRVMDASFALRTASLYDWETRYGAYRWDSESGYYQVRNRYLHPTLGRWLSRDPLGYADGVNLYAYVGNRPINLVDPTGNDSNGTTDNGGTLELQDDSGNHFWVTAQLAAQDLCCCKKPGMLTLSITITATGLSMSGYTTNGTFTFNGTAIKTKVIYSKGDYFKITGTAMSKLPECPDGPQSFSSTFDGSGEDNGQTEQITYKFSWEYECKNKCPASCDTIKGFTVTKTTWSASGGGLRPTKNATPPPPSAPPSAPKAQLHT